MKGRLLALFFSHLALLLREGVPLTRALDVLQEQQPPGSRLARELPEMNRQLCAGQCLSFVLAARPDLFPAISSGLVKVGESTGALVAVLEKLGAFLEREDAFKRRTWHALGYPLFVLFAALVLTAGLLVTVVPSFTTMLRELNAPLPLPTRMLLAASGFVSHPVSGAATLAAVLASLWLFRRYAETPGGSRQLFESTLRIPVAGKLLEMDCFTRYCDSLELALTTGVPYVVAFRLAAGVCGHPGVMDDAAALVEALKDGETAAEHMAGLPELYPRSLVTLLRSGEETGLLTQFLGVASRSLELEVVSLRAMMLSSLEPLLMMGVAALVGGMVLSLLLPLQSTLSKLLDS